MWVVFIPLSVFAMYLWMIAPKVLKRRDLRKITNVLIAHRGLYGKDDGIPENSHKAFLKAIEYGFGIELDVQLTKDEVPVIIHDRDLLRVCGKRHRVSEIGYGKLSGYRLFGTEEYVPRLADVLRLVDGRVPLVIEIKSETRDTLVCEKVMELLKDYQGDYVVESFNPLTLLWFRRRHPKVIRGQLTTDFKREGQEGSWFLFLLMKHLLFNFLSKPDFIAINHLYQGTLSYRICKWLYKVPSLAWNVRSKRDLKENEKGFQSYIFDGFLPDVKKT